MLCKIFKSKNGYVNYEKIGGDLIPIESSIEDFISNNDIEIKHILQSQSSCGDSKNCDTYLFISIFYNLK